MYEDTVLTANPTKKGRNQYPQPVTGIISRYGVLCLGEYCIVYTINSEAHIREWSWRQQLGDNGG